VIVPFTSQHPCKGIRSGLWINEKLDPLQSALEALKRDTVLKKS
jgi:hypothetical protein